MNNMTKANDKSKGLEKKWESLKSDSSYGLYVFDELIAKIRFVYVFQSYKLDFSLYSTCYDLHTNELETAKTRAEKIIHEVLKEKYNEHSKAANTLMQYLMALDCSKAKKKE